MASSKRQWVLLAPIIVFFIIVLLVNRNFYLQYIPQSDALLSIDQEAEVQLKQVDIARAPRPCAKACSQKPTTTRFFSQCGEDNGVYTQYFSNPFVQCNGTYVEIGALNGITYSNTKFFEDTLGWNGVLIEAQPKNYEGLKKNRPKSKTYGMAICSEEQKFVRFAGGGAVGGQVDQMSEHHKKHYIRDAQVIEVPCMPMGKLLREAGVTHVDFFSLDVEGAELMVLQTMDWSIPVRVFVIEFGHNKEKDDAVRELLTKNGYVKPPWDIRKFCRKGGDCAPNEVFENINQEQFTCR